MIIPVRSLGLRYAVAVLCLSTLVLVGAGCGKRTAKVSGTVMLHGKPLEGGGTVTFQGPKGGVSSQINLDGTYTIPNAPVGEVQIVLASGMSRGLEPYKPTDFKNLKQMPKQRKGPNRPLNNIPEKYTKLETSGLTYTVKPQDQTFDISLTSR